MDFISIEKGENLFWLGRYVERVYRTLNYLEGLYDVLIDTDETAYKEFCAALNIPDVYEDASDFMTSYFFDELNPDSVYSNLSRAYDDGILLRNTISTRSLAYIQLALDAMEDAKAEGSGALCSFEVIDRLLAFWGSIDEYLSSGQERCLVKAGRYLERLDMQLRLGESWETIGVTIGKLDRRLQGAKIAYSGQKMRVLKNFAQLADDDPETRLVALETVQKLLNKLDTMKKFLYSLRADLLFSEPVSNHTFVLRSVPLSEPGQEPMRISLTCQPGCRLSETFDGQGNKVFLGSIENKHTFFSFCSTGEVLVDSSQRSSFGAAAYYRYPTQLTTLTGTLKDYFEANKVEGAPIALAEYWLTKIGTDFRRYDNSNCGP